MIILIGPSASGKTATCLYLQEHYNIKKVITHTTREKRDNEVDGVDYYFVSKEEFLKLKRDGFFIETVTFNGNYYGTSKKEVKLDKSLAVEFNGAQTFAAQNDDRIVFFYLKISEETRLKRMQERGDAPEKIKSRLESDRESYVLNKKINDIIDDVVDTEKLTLSEAAKHIYNKYIEILKKRNIDISNIINKK